MGNFPLCERTVGVQGALSGDGWWVNESFWVWTKEWKSTLYMGMSATDCLVRNLDRWDLLQTAGSSFTVTGLSGDWTRWMSVGWTAQQTESKPGGFWRKLMTTSWVKWWRIWREGLFFRIVQSQKRSVLLTLSQIEKPFFYLYLIIFFTFISTFY